MSKNHIVENLRKQIEKFQGDLKTEKVGHVVEIFDGIARVSGLSDLKASEMVTFASGANGVALNLEEDTVGIIVLGDFSKIHEGEEVKATGQILSVPDRVFQVRQPVLKDKAEQPLSLQLTLYFSHLQLPAIYR